MVIDYLIQTTCQYYHAYIPHLFFLLFQKSLLDLRISIDSWGHFPVYPGYITKQSYYFFLKVKCE